MKEWIIPVIIAIVWILNAVLRNRENDEPVRVPRGKAGGGRPDRAPASDIDRFLQEIEAMKKRATAAAPPAPAKPAAPKPRPAARPAGPTARPSTPRVRIIVGEAPAVAAPPAVAVTLPEPPQVRTPRPSMIAPPAAASPGRRPTINALQLLRSPSAAINAVILSEILGPPKSRRR
jgi:hypothetical protein